MTKQASTVIDEKGNLYIVTSMIIHVPRVVPSLQNKSFQASNPEQVAAWILGQNYGPFIGFTFLSSKEMKKEDSLRWKGEIRLLAPNKFVYRIDLELSYIVDPIKTAYVDMTPEEQSAYLAKALAKAGITI